MVPSGDQSLTRKLEDSGFETASLHVTHLGRFYLFVHLLICMIVYLFNVFFCIYLLSQGSQEGPGGYNAGGGGGDSTTSGDDGAGGGGGGGHFSGCGGGGGANSCGNDGGTGGTASNVVSKIWIKEKPFSFHWRTNV